ncbi:MAG: BlaI/MecI/CopY family transcriptional regulator [bacterium]|nr:BlaI/MecI/CopY family transcriptional regulator [bacterium]
MARKHTGRPTDAELALLSVLWEHGPSTVRAVHDRLGDGVGYTTVLKTLQIMTEKGLVIRDESARAHVYAAAQAREETQGRLVVDLVDRAFAGSASKLVMNALSGQRASRAELDAIRRLLDDLEEDES